MAIRFACANAACSQTMRAGEELAGTPVRCPRCGMVQTVPRASIQPGGPPEDGAISCPDCGTSFPAGELLCPKCGWVNPTLQPPLPARPRPPARPARAPRSDLSLAGEFLKAIAYGTSNFRSIVVLVLYFIGLAFLLRLVLLVFGVFLMWTPLGNLIMAALGLMVQLIAGGYFLRYYLEVIVGSLEGDNQAPNLPPLAISVLYRTGFKGVCILLVYAAPIVTLPLLPLSLLASGYSDDSRAFDVLWAARAARRRPRQLAILWGVLLLWLGAGFAATWAIMLVAGLLAGAALAISGFAGWLAGFAIMLAAWTLAAMVNVMFGCVGFRCVGLFGRHNPVVLEMLPESDEFWTAAAYIAAGAAVSALLWLLAIWPMLKSLTG